MKGYYGCRRYTDSPLTNTCVAAVVEVSTDHIWRWAWRGAIQHGGRFDAAVVEWSLEANRFYYDFLSFFWLLTDF